MLSDSGVKKVLGQAAAAKQNSQRRARGGILEAVRRLGIPYDEWPDFVQAYYKDSNQLCQQLIWVGPFQPPPFDRLNESAAEYRKKIHAAFDQHVDPTLDLCESLVQQGIDETIDTKRSRGPGKAEPGRKRKNTDIELRYEWAARRLWGEPWKEIAAKYHTPESTVIKAASALLRIAGWPTKPKLNTSNTPAPYMYQKFPRWKYHRSKPACIVEDAEQESALGEGWSDAPQDIQVE
jgi:hypothetical protein